jgi:hypothetical protein
MNKQSTEILDENLLKSSDWGKGSSSIFHFPTGQ